uniref:Uncharacterized protein n=1 Tax=Sinocyclocheilus anshuiensis TaxID=1608454 RepID=A0A671QQ29_9TELE
MNCVWLERKTHTVQSLFLSVQCNRSGDHSGHCINMEVLPVSISCSSLQEAVPDLSIHPLILVCGKHFIHHQPRWLFLAIGRPHKDRPVIIDIYDGDLKTGGSPEWRSAMIGRHHSQIKPLKTLQ